jgi:hypothetical protein
MTNRLTLTEEGLDLIAWAVYKNLPSGVKDKLAYDEAHNCPLSPANRMHIVMQLVRYTPTSANYPDLISRVTAIFH